MGSAGTAFVGFIAILFFIFLFWVLFKVTRTNDARWTGYNSILRYLPFANWNRSRQARQFREEGRILALDERRLLVRKRWAEEDGMDEKRTAKIFGAGNRKDLERGVGRSHQPVSKICGLERLPAELRIDIYAYLDCCSALSLETTNRFFHHDRVLRCIDQNDRATYVYHAETFRKNHDRLACFGCLRVRDPSVFTTRNRSGDFRKFGVNEFERLCFDCEVEKGLTRWPNLKKMIRTIRAE